MISVTATAPARNKPAKPKSLKHWQAKFENFLYIEGRKATRRRYAVALERFLGAFPRKKFGHDFLRPDVMDYVKLRMAEGASPATINVELAAVRSFFDFMLRLECYGIMFNPAKGVKAHK